MAYCDRDDIIIAIDEHDLIQLLDDERILDDLKAGKIYQFQVDTNATSGHFETSGDVAVTLGPGNTAPRVRANSKFRLSSGWYEITSITDDGEAADEVAVSTCYYGDAVPDTGVYIVEEMEPEKAEERLDRYIADADAWIDTVLRRNGWTVPVTMDGSSDANTIRNVAVEHVKRNLFTRRKGFNPEKSPYTLRGNKQLEDMLTALKPSHASDLLTIQSRDEYMQGRTETPFYQQNRSRDKMRGW